MYSTHRKKKKLFIADKQQLRLLDRLPNVMQSVSDTEMETKTDSPENNYPSLKSEIIGGVLPNTRRFLFENRKNDGFFASELLVQRGPLKDRHLVKSVFRHFLFENLK